MFHSHSGVYRGLIRRVIKRSSLLWIPVEKTDVAYKDLSFFLSFVPLLFPSHPAIYHTYLSFRCVLSSSIIGGEGKLRSNRKYTHTFAHKHRKDRYYTLYGYEPDRTLGRVNMPVLSYVTLKRYFHTEQKTGSD